MNINLLLFGIINILHLLPIIESQSNCSPPFQEVPYSSGKYCAKCDTTCATCSGSAINQCASCPTDFTLNTDTSTCAAPISSTINTVLNNYHFFNFQKQSTWFGGDATAYSCGQTTVLRGTSNQIIYTTHLLNIHYKIRVRFSFWNFDAASRTVTINIKTTTDVAISTNTSGGTVAANFNTGQSYFPYCSGSYAINYEVEILDGRRSVKVQFTSSAASWGIRQYIFIQYICYLADCASCSGPLQSQCTSCVDPNKYLYTNPGTCECDHAKGYYSYPTGNSSYFCVNPCPNRPEGQYYGDNQTQACVLTCPTKATNTLYWGLTFASDGHNFCVQTCPASITLGNVTRNLFYDLVNRKCVTECPSTQPYSNPTDKACYSSCPINSGVQYYKLNTQMRCVNICPAITNSASGVHIPLFRDILTLSCVQVCPSGYYGYHNTSDGDRYCVINSCPGLLFADNSTGRSLCTEICPAPNYFGDTLTLPRSCVQVCSFGTFGDTQNSNRFCVQKCNLSYYGLQTGNRQCIQKCPTGNWGERITLICMTQPYQCNIAMTYALYQLAGGYTFTTSYRSFADNYTNMCIYANQTCSIGMFKLNSSLTCQTTCPSGTYANTITYWCVDRCYGLYFADPYLNRCVLKCSPGLYADRGSDNKCLTHCNQSGAYPYRDNNIRQCVSICTLGYSDIASQFCVFSCTAGFYLSGVDQTDQALKICAQNCSAPYFAYNNTDSGICLKTCPNFPITFGDVVQGLRVCVSVCSIGYYGDQTNTTGNNYGSYTQDSFRKCVPRCAAGTFAQNDNLRRCVTRCNSSTFGRTTDWTCVIASNCPDAYTGDLTTNLCVNWCPPSNGTFADNISKMCVSRCPIVGDIIYYADIHIRWCIQTCINYNASASYFGNNLTQTCQLKCLDNNSFADVQSPRRYCIDLCTHTNLAGVLTKYYRNNFTKICVISTGCSNNYFADNSTYYCVEQCPVVNGTQTWGYIPTKTCVALCLPTYFGDDSSGKALCVQLCAQFPVPKWSYKGPNDVMSIMLCKTVCPDPYFGQDFLRTCVTNCPRANQTIYSSNPFAQTFAYTGTRRCLFNCPDTFFADYRDGVCFPQSINCTKECWYSWTNCSLKYRWGDAYNNSCTYLCTSTPYDTYGDNVTQKCTTFCSVDSYADSFSGTRICVAQCFGYYTAQGVVNTTFVDNFGNPYDSYGDNYTRRCQKKCVIPNTYADWQTHLCSLRCTGDDPSTVPTYAERYSMRCVIALFCPEIPDKYFGQNITRMCQPSCPMNTSTNNISFADNITRTCLPICFQYTNVSSSNLTTRFYGDSTTNRPACVIACSANPRQFGQNSTFLCVNQCPDFQYGDQTGNRSCVPVCPNIGGVTWFSQLTQRICVTVCQNNTWGNYYNSSGPHCETVPTDCKPGQFAENSTHMCVPLCPESLNYFGDQSTRRCVNVCPYLSNVVVNTTAFINRTSGRTFADYKTRLCVYKCPLDFGLQGTFGDNSTNVCVQRCPTGSYGDSHTTNRYCVANCTEEGFADPYSTLCVDICPASPPTFGYTGNWTCVKSCPINLWANSITRRCQSACNPNFRLSLAQNQCVSVCPSYPDLYGDDNGYNCTAVCTLNRFADPTDRLCKSSCSPLFQYNYRCVKVCPHGFYAKLNKNCVVPNLCDDGYYGDNSTTQCVNPCPAWSYADPNSRYCIAICPDGWYGQNNVCVQNCSNGKSASNITQLCQSMCTNGTFSHNGVCVNTCSGSKYQNQQTRTCADSCPSGLFADPTTNRCVAYCPTGWFRQSTGSMAGFCVLQINGCKPLFSDNITGNCVTKCSSGYWGYKDSSNSTHTFIGNYSCNSKCPTSLGVYGFQNSNQRNCYPPNGLPLLVMRFADRISGQFVTNCPQTPVIYFGDRNRQQCVNICTPFLLSGTLSLFYGDPQTRQCQQTCQNQTYSRDPITSLCTLRCTLGTYRYNITPICSNPCPVGFGDYTSRTCIQICPAHANTFGFYNQTSGSRLCLQLCPFNYYAEPLLRTCTTLCPLLNGTVKYFAYNDTRQCLTYCKKSFADPDLRVCASECKGLTYKNADNSTNRCVQTCPDNPQYYSDNRVCVYFCTTPNYFADKNGRICSSRCSNFTTIQYGDKRTGKCEVKCSQGTWGDNTTNLCVSTCPLGSFADNTSGLCVAQCPKNENIYADMLLHVCSYKCSGGYFGSQVNQTCIPVCDNDYWGDPTTTLCTKICPVKIYSYGQNVTRTCVSSCIGYTGFADNSTRICRQYCQHTLGIQTYIDYTNKACVSKCPPGTWAANFTSGRPNECLTQCPIGFGDNFTRWCVNVCPDNPQSYGDTFNSKCVYNCTNGYFSDNTTNLCVQKCPSLNSSIPIDYYGDPVNSRCVFWCTQGTYAQNDSRLCINPCPSGEFADNLTRRCVSNCPPSQNTFADNTTHRCVRICPRGYWAENTTQSCVPDCWTYTTGPLSGIVGYEDNLTNFCVAVCPFFYFGTNTSHSCVLQCPVSLNEYGHYIGRVCVGTNDTGVVDCYQVNNTIYYGDPSTRTCVQKCPIDLWADNHIFKCVPICNALLSPPQYRNNHTQKCVWPCPEDPDQFADSQTGNCVRTCPNGKYAYTGNRTCVSSCGQFNLFADNTTNRCEATCSTRPFFYADNLTWTCVYHCSGMQFADNKTQKCVPICPRQWEYFGEIHNKTCVPLCPHGQYADKFSQTCVPYCSNDYFADNFTSTCVQNCRLIRPFWYEDISTGYKICVNLCPGQSYGYNPDQTCKYQDNNTFASTCPSPLYYADRISRQCVKFCPNGTFSNTLTRYCQTTCSGIYYADPILRQCRSTCSPNLYKYNVSNSSNLCVQYCPENLFAHNATSTTDSECVQTCLNFGLPSTRTCQDYCPYPYYSDDSRFLCRLSCQPRFTYKPNRTCLIACISPYFGNPLTHQCQLLCPDTYYGKINPRMCSQTCQNLTFADPSTRICVTNCPSYPILFADSRYNKCLPQCSHPLFGFQNTMSCVQYCPNITNNSKILIYLADTSNRLCVLQCVNDIDTYADFQNNLCTRFCPNGTFASNYSKQCVYKCPDEPVNTYAHNTSRMCLTVCPDGSYGMPNNLTCVQFCWWPYFASTTTNTCVDLCPAGFFAVNTTAFCRNRCPDFSYADPVTRRCLEKCPALHKYFNYDGNWTCLLTCPPGFYANTDLNQCVSICNSSNGTFAYSVTNECVRQCPIPYKGYTVDRSCVLTCPAIRYFYDVTINQCANCQTNCYICITGTMCTQCMAGFNLFNGICNISCIPQPNSITYANPSGLCVTLCPPTYFGDNSTYSCKQTCPIKLYGDNITRLCTNCPGTCSVCTSSLICSSCQSGATLAIDQMCYRDCNGTHKYTYNQTCWATCPNGTFITYTSVTCGLCSPICYTCSGTAIFCMSCIKTFFFNNTCLTVCPNGYYGSTALLCLSCSLNQTACSKPLNFTSSYSTQNFKPVITLQFNQLVTISKDLSQILNINIKATRRLQEVIQTSVKSLRNLQIGSLINNGIQYTYQIFPNGTIKLYPIIASNILNPTFSVSISDPTAVVSSATGLTLQNVESLLEIAYLQYYPPQQGQQASTNFPAKFVSIIFLVLYVMSFILSDTMIKPIQILQILFFHCAINVNIPPNLFYFLKNMQSTTFYFVDNIFKNNFPIRSPYIDSPLKFIDVFIDQIFLRNLGQIFIWIFIFVGLWFIFLILSNKRIVSHKIWHNFFEQVSIKRYRWMILHDIFGLFYFPILYFSFMQIKATLTIFSNFYIYNSLITILFLIIALILPFIWLFMWFKNTAVETSNKLWFLTTRSKKIQSQLQKISDEKAYSQRSQQIMKNNNNEGEQRDENKKHNNINHLETIQFMAYQILLAIWMVGLYNSPKTQLIMLIITNLLHLTYNIGFRPFLNNLNLIFNILSTIMIIAFEGFFIYFYDNSKMYANQKHNVAFEFLIAASIFCILLLLWGCWRFIWEINLYVRNFKGTLLYLQFADHDYIGQKQQSQKFSQYDKLVQNNVIHIGDLVMDEIIQKVGPSGEKLIAVKKKRLRKKQKLQGRKKQDDLISDKQDKYMRVNHINVFDYNDNFDQSQKQQIKIEHRKIDDDIRQEYGDKIAQYQEEEKKIDVQPEQYLIRDIEDINQPQKSEEQVFDFMQEQKKSEQAQISFKPYQIQNKNQVLQQPSFNKIEKHKNQEIQQSGNHQKLEKKDEKVKEEGPKKQAADNNLDNQQQAYNNLQSQFDQLNIQNMSQNNGINVNELQIKSQESQVIHQVNRKQQFQLYQGMEQSQIKPQDHKVETKIKNIEDLLLQQQKPGNKKNLLFLFDDFQQQN